jgi:hypothetical protein
MKEYLTSSIIDASPETVWQILTDGARYPEWNPEIIRIVGTIAAGARITAHVRLGDGAVRAVSQRVTQLEAPKRMVWEGGLPLGLFIGRRTFTLHPAGSGVEFRMHLHMSGAVSPLIIKSVGDRQSEVDRFSQALKRRAETTPT